MDKITWGEDSLSAKNVSASYIASMADWSSYFAAKGYAMPYPMLLYAVESAEKLYDDLMAELTQWHRFEDTRIDLFTLFDGAVEKEIHEHKGLLIMRVQGLSHLNPLFVPEVETILRSGAAGWVSLSYDSEQVMTRIEWIKEEDLDPSRRAQVETIADSGTAPAAIYMAWLTPHAREEAGAGERD